MCAMSSRKKARINATVGSAIGLANLEQVPDNWNVNKKLLDCASEECCVQKAYSFIIRGMWESRYILIECSICLKDWFLCIACGQKQRTRIETIKQLQNHTSNNHSAKKIRSKGVEMQPTFLDQTDDQIDFTVDDYDCYGSVDGANAGAWSEVVNSNNLGFLETKNSVYFQQSYLGPGTLAGMKYLVMRSTRRSNLDSTEYASQSLPPGHALLQTSIAQLAFTLTRGQAETLAKVLRGAYKVGCENGFASCQSHVEKELDQLAYAKHTPELLKAAIQCDFSHDLVDKEAYSWSTKVPSNWNDMRQMYLEGARSIVENLPIPRIKKDIPGHSYVSLSDCIRHFLAHRDLSDVATIPADLSETELKEVHHSSVSSRANEILGTEHIESLLKSYVILWSDDVEPNQMKANRGSVWLLTATIATHLDNGHRMENTLPIAVGRKGDNHDRVISKLEEDMKDLRSGACSPFYVGRPKKKVRIAFEMFCTLQDQPERRDFNSMRAGNGSTTGRFGVSADHSALYTRNVLPACRACLEKMEAALQQEICAWPMSACEQCVRWDVFDDRNGLAFWVAPTDYPEVNKITNKQITQEDGVSRYRRCLSPFQISYETLKDAVDTAHRGYVDEGWSNQNCETFLEVEGMSTKHINTVMEHCARTLSLKLAKQDPENHQDILDAAESNPELYSKAPNPSPWERPTIPLVLHPDVIMHLIFLGVVKTTVKQIQKCLSVQSKLASFLKSTEDYLTEFQTMQIDWMPIQPYQGGKLGGWVSENYLAFSRILPWFFQNIDAAVESTTDFVPPEDLPPNKWLLRHNKYWLQIRGLDAKGLSAGLKERVAEHMTSGAPDPLPAPEIPTASVQAVLLALKDVLECVMSKTVTPALINRTRYAVRVFLSKYDSLSRPLKQSNPAVLSSYNFICLLNLPDVMERFGPLRCIWEGGPRGEGFVRFAKPLMTQGLRQNWQHQLLQKMHRAISFSSVLQENRPKVAVDLNHKDTLRERKGSFRMYKTAFDVRLRFDRRRSIQERKPVSVVLAESSGVVEVFAIVRGYDTVLPILLAESPSVECFGFHYYSFGVDKTKEEGISWMTVVAKNVTRVEFGVLLPLLTADDTDNRFALVASNWRSLSPLVNLTGLVE